MYAYIWVVSICNVAILSHAWECLRNTNPALQKKVLKDLTCCWNHLGPSTRTTLASLLGTEPPARRPGRRPGVSGDMEDADLGMPVGARRQRALLRASVRGGIGYTNTRARSDMRASVARVARMFERRQEVGNSPED